MKFILKRIIENHIHKDKDYRISKKRTKINNKKNR